jgi:hypothetical protein
MHLAGSTERAALYMNLAGANILMDHFNVSISRYGHSTWESLQGVFAEGLQTVQTLRSIPTLVISVIYMTNNKTATEGYL